MTPKSPALRQRTLDRRSHVLRHRLHSRRLQHRDVRAGRPPTTVTGALVDLAHPRLASAVVLDVLAYKAVLIDGASKSIDPLTIGGGWRPFSYFFRC